MKNEHRRAQNIYIRLEIVEIGQFLSEQDSVRKFHGQTSKVWGKSAKFLIPAHFRHCLKEKILENTQLGSPENWS